MSESCYQTLLVPNLKHSYNIPVGSASGRNLYPMGLITCTFHLGKETFTFKFIVGKTVTRPFILGLDFCEDNKTGVEWSDTGRRILTHDKLILVG